METQENHCNLSPRVIICRECGEPFVLSPGERQFYIDRKLKEPSRCADCRARRRAEAGDRR
jgi:hypothetical protein